MEGKGIVSANGGRGIVKPSTRYNVEESQSRGAGSGGRIAVSFVKSTLTSTSVRAYGGRASDGKDTKVIGKKMGVLFSPLILPLLLEKGQQQSWHESGLWIIFL